MDRDDLINEIRAGLELLDVLEQELENAIGRVEDALEHLRGVREHMKKTGDNVEPVVAAERAEERREAFDEGYDDGYKDGQES